MKELKS